MWHGMEGIGWGWLGLGFLHMAVFWGLVILAFVALLKWLGGGLGDESRAIDILKARYAKGELTREQFEQLRREIGEDGK
jgi:putative membrane protein